MIEHNNRRFIALIRAIVILAVTTVAAMVVLIALGQGVLAATVPAFVGTIITMMIAMTRAEQQNTDATVGREEIKATVQDAAVKAKAAATLAAHVAQKTEAGFGQVVQAAASEVRAATEAVTADQVREIVRVTLAEQAKGK